MKLMKRLDSKKMTFDAWHKEFIEIKKQIVT